MLFYFRQSVTLLAKSPGGRFSRKEGANLPNSTLVTSRKVVTEPGDVRRLRGVDGTRGDEDTRVDDARLGRHAAHGEADQHDEHADYNEGSTPTLPIGEVCNTDSDGSCGDVYGDGQKLRRRALVAELLDDCR